MIKAFEKLWKIFSLWITPFVTEADSNHFTSFIGVELREKSSMKLTQTRDARERKNELLIKFHIAAAENV